MSEKLSKLLKILASLKDRERLKKFIKQPSTVKGLFAVAMGVSIFMYPEKANELVAAWLTAYGIFDTARNEDKKIKDASHEEEGL